MNRIELSDCGAFCLAGEAGGRLQFGPESFADGYLYFSIRAETPTFGGTSGGCCTIERLIEFLQQAGELVVGGRQTVELFDLEGQAEIAMSVIDRRGTIAVHCRLSDG